MGLFTLHNCWVLCLFDYLKSYLESNSRLPISDFSGSLCRLNTQSGCKDVGTNKFEFVAITHFP